MMLVVIPPLMTLILHWALPDIGCEADSVGMYFDSIASTTRIIMLIADRPLAGLDEWAAMPVVRKIAIR